MTSTNPQMRTLAAFVKGNVPVLLWGDPGRGKTARITAASVASGYHTEVVVGSVRESSDYLGLPMEVDGTVVYSPPAWAVRLANAPKGVLFLDELTTCAPSVQKAQLRLAQERYAGDQHIGENTRIIAAANPPETSADGWDLPAPIANRFGHIEWVFDSTHWLANVGTNFAHDPVVPFDDMLDAGRDTDRARVVGLVTGFLRVRPDLLAPNPPTDPVEAGKAWPSPRSWTNVISVLSEVPAHDDEVFWLVVKGLVGEGAAKEFFAWIQVSDLHDPADVMADPSIVDWSGERPDRLFAVLSGVENLALARADAKSWEQAMEVMTVAAENKRPDIALPAVRTLFNHRPTGTTLTDRTRNQFVDLLSLTQNAVYSAA